METSNVEPGATPAVPIRTIDSGSRLRHPREFVREAVSDLDAARPTILRFFRRSLIQRYRDARLGLLWAVAPSLLVALLITAGQRARMVGEVPGNVPASFYGVIGILIAQTFLDGINSTRGLFGSNQALLVRGNLRIEGLIGAALVDCAFNTALRVVVGIGAFAWFAVPPATTAPLAIAGLLAVLISGCGVGLLVAPQSTLQRDLNNLFGFLPWILFATTPVFVAPRPGTLMHTVTAFNPLTPLFDSVRTAAYAAPGSALPCIFALPVGSVLLVAGWLACRFWRPYVVERMV